MAHSSPEMKTLADSSLGYITRVQYRTDGISFDRFTGRLKAELQRSTHKNGDRIVGELAGALRHESALPGSTHPVLNDTLSSIVE
jgi:hypothetical protein